MRSTCAVGLLFTFALGQPAQPPRPSSLQAPPPSGQRVVVGDGDLVVADNGARIRLVQRTDARVRTIYNAASRWVILLADTTDAGGRRPDGGVDASLIFYDVNGEWPLGERWDGDAVLEEYSLPSQPGSRGVGLVTPRGLVQLLSVMGADSFRDQNAAAALSYRGSGRGGGGNRPFDAAEAQQVESAQRNVAGNARMPGGFSSSVSMTVAPVPPGGAPAVAPSVAGTSVAPVRVGGSIRPPVKVVDVQAVLPPVAEQANIRGVVILEIVVGTDGAVRDIKILRSISLLDQAAINAVSQWRYEPTLLNGVPVPVIMTVTVGF